MNILILNWRDIGSPHAGGAEILTHEMAKRWVKSGHTVTQFSARYSGAKKNESIDGVRIIREGSAEIRSLSVPVFVAAFFWYRREGNRQFDVVIDEIHGIPFFTPWYVRKPIVALICEVAHEIWDIAFPAPLNVIGKFVESQYFRWYRKVPFLTISESTKSDLLVSGIHNKNITVLPMGFSKPQKIPAYTKEKYPTLLFVARLTKAKGIEDACLALEYVLTKYPNAKLWVVGQGESQYELYLQKKLKNLIAKDQVKFYGFVNEQKKFELMARAHVLIVPSIKEGWGLTVPEAAIVGTPAVGYRVAGLKDIITSGTNGLLTDPNPKSLADGVIKLLGNRDLYLAIVRGGMKKVMQYTWNDTAEIALSILKKVTQKV